MPARRYRRKPGQPVVAIRLDLDTDGIRYLKWGAEQHGKRGDWLVDSNGDVYTVDADSFAATYRSLGRGLYAKTAPVWAERAAQDGVVATREGLTHYRAGDYLVRNNEDGSDAYALAANKFELLYEADE